MTPDVFFSKSMSWSAVCIYGPYLDYTCLLFMIAHVITCWVRADPYALLCVMFSCVFVTFPFGVQGQV